MLHVPSTPPASSCFQLCALLGWLCLLEVELPQERMGQLRRNSHQRLKQVAVFLLRFFGKVLKGRLGR